MQEGQKVTIGEREFTFSPVTLGVMRRHKLLGDFKIASQIKANVPTEEEVDAMLRILHASAQISEPTLSLDQFCEQGVDRLPFLEGVTAIARAIPVVLMLSGFVRPGEEAKATGEALGSQT